MALGALPNHCSCPLADPAPGRDGLVNSWRTMVWRCMVGGALPLPGIILQAMSSPSPLGHHGSWQGGSYRLGCGPRRQFLDGIPGGAHSAFAGSQPGWVLLGQWSQLPWEHRWPQQLFFFPLFSLAPPITPLLHPIGNRAGGNVSRGGARQLVPLTGAPPALVSATVCCPAPAPCGAGAAHGLATIGPMVTGSAQISLMPRSNLNMTTAPPSPAPTKSR